MAFTELEKALDKEEMDGEAFVDKFGCESEEMEDEASVDKFGCESEEMED